MRNLLIAAFIIVGLVSQAQKIKQDDYSKEFITVKDFEYKKPFPLEKYEDGKVKVMACSKIDLTVYNKTEREIVAFKVMVQLYNVFGESEASFNLIYENKTGSQEIIPSKSFAITWPLIGDIFENVTKNSTYHIKITNIVYK